MSPEQTCLLGTRNSVQGHRTTKNPLSTTYYVPARRPELLHTLTLPESQANPARLGRHLCLTSGKTKAERRSAPSVEPLGWGEAPEGLNLGLPSVKACLLTLGVTWHRPFRWHQHVSHPVPPSQVLPYLHTPPTIAYFMFFFQLVSWLYFFKVC